MTSKLNSKKSALLVWRLLGVVFLVFIGVRMWNAYRLSQELASVSIGVTDTSRNPNDFEHVPNVQVNLYDAHRNLLASGNIPSRFAEIQFQDHPCSRETIGSYGSLSEWEACVENKMRWQKTWIDKLAFATVHTGACNIEGVAVEINKYTDNQLLSWLPQLTPHLGGGSPAPAFYVQLWIDGAHCKAAGPYTVVS